MATGNEKRLPALRAIVSTSVNARFASCGEREANAVFFFLFHLVPSSMAEKDVCICVLSRASCTAALMSDYMTMKHSCSSQKATICRIPGPALPFCFFFFLSAGSRRRDTFFIALQYHIFSFNNSLAILFSFSD